MQIDIENYNMGTFAMKAKAPDYVVKRLYKGKPVLAPV